MIHKLYYTEDLETYSYSIKIAKVDEKVKIVDEKIMKHMTTLLQYCTRRTAQRIVGRRNPYVLSKFTWILGLSHN